MWTVEILSGRARIWRIPGNWFDDSKRESDGVWSGEGLKRVQREFLRGGEGIFNLNAGNRLARVQIL